MFKLFVIASIWCLVSIVSRADRATSAGDITSHEYPQPVERIKNEPESVWVEFIQLALDHKPLDLGQGFPDFAAPQYLVESLENATRVLPQTDINYKQNVRNNQYTRSFGHPRLIRALQKYYNQQRDFTELKDERRQILVTVGAYEALFVSLMAFVQPGDQVVIIDPAFDAYAPIVSLAGGENIYVPLRYQSTSNKTLASIGTEQFFLDMNELESKLAQNKTRVLVLNTPNNPLGKVYSLKELEHIASLCVRYNILVIADEVYEHLYYGTNQHKSIAQLPGMWQRTITIGSAGKTFSVTGWKIGWALGPEHLLRYAQLVHQTAIYTVATPLQEAIARAFEYEMNMIGGAKKEDTLTGDDYWSWLRGDLLRKRDRMARILSSGQMQPILPQGGYFMLANFSSLAKAFPEFASGGEQEASKSTGTRNRSNNSKDYKFARWLSSVRHLQGIPGSAFYSKENKHLAQDFIRFCFIKSEQTLDDFERVIGELNESSRRTR